VFLLPCPIPTHLLLLQTGEYSFSMLVWHEQLLYPADQSAAARLAERLKGFSFMGGVRSMLTRSK
jgi:hypothetical protein